MHSPQTDYLVPQFEAPLGMKQDSIKCIVKNTFLELAEDTDPSESMRGARIRSSSAPSLMRTSLMRRSPSFDDDGEVAKEEIDTIFAWHAERNRSDSFSTIPSIDGDGSSSESSHSDEWESPGRAGSPIPSETSSSDHQSEEEEASNVTSMELQTTCRTKLATPPLLKEEVLEALQKLTDLDAEERMKREDIEQLDVTELLCPFIPVDDEGNSTSLGSILHAEGTCKPCAFLKKDRCRRKDLCLYCHIEHENAAPVEKRNRLSAAKRKRRALKEFILS